MLLIILIVFCIYELFLKYTTGKGVYQTYVDPTNTSFDYNATAAALIGWAFLMYTG